MGVGGRSAGTVQDVIHAVTAAEREGPEQEERTMQGQPRSREWGEAQVLATCVRWRKYVAWKGPVSFKNIARVHGVI